jgi:hypothetical protein
MPRPDNPGNPDQPEQGQDQGQNFREVQIQGTDAQTGEQVTLTARVNPGGQVKLEAPDAPQPPVEQPAQDQGEGQPQ